MGSITVTAPANCSWTTTGNPGWVTINSGASGTGNGTISYTVATNNSPSARQATLTISGQSFLVNQGGQNGSCAVTPIVAGQTLNGTLAISDCYSLQRGQRYPADRYSFSGTAGQRVAIRADSSVVDTFLYLMDPTGTVVASNDDGDSRTSARIPAGTGFFTLPSSGVYQIEVTSFSTTAATGAYSVNLSSGSTNCSYTASPAEQSFAAAGSNGSIAVTVTGTGCTWTASSNADWVMITSGATGGGNGTVNFTVTANSGLTRTAYVVVAGQLVSITQTGAGAAAFGRWDVQTSGTFNQLNQVYFLDDTHGWTVGGNSTAFSTSDGGASWNPFSVGGPIQSLNSVRFFDANLGWVGGEKLTATTTNGGLSWPRLDFTTGTRYRIFPVDATNAFTVGELGGGGFVASTVMIPFLGFGSETQTLTTLYPLRDVSFFNSDNGWAVGDKGLIFRMSKGGSHFDEQTGATTQNLNGIFALDLSTAWAVGNGGIILKTTNGGTNWTQQPSGVTTPLRAVYFLNTDRGWAVGDGGVILVTHNGGNVWAPENSSVAADLRSVHATSLNAAYAVGANGTIVKRSPCAFTLSATMASFEFGGGTGSFNVTTTGGCQWAATSNANWITITSGSPGSGNGTVNFSITANTGPARMGAITVADQTFTITQAVSCVSVSGINPTSGVVGATVTITGTNFTSVNAVKFSNNVPATFTVVGDTQIATTVPAGATTGSITIGSQLCGEVTTPTFTVLPKPTIMLTPSSPLAGVGQTIQFTATISQTLPTGISLMLNSSNPAVGSVPLNPSIQAGQTSAQFNVSGASAGTTIITVTVPAQYGGASANTTLTVAAGFEADVAPRPNGNVNGQVTVTDWTQVGRFIAGLDTAAVGNEFQRADCAPRGSLGDGRLTIIDWVQAGRYAAGLDPVVAMGGPTAPIPFAAKEEPLSLLAAGTSLVRAELVQTKSLTTAGKDQQVIKLAAQGDENALSFSLMFEPSKWRFLSAELTDETAGATLIINREQAAQGKLGFLFAYPTGKTLPSGEIRLFTVTFEPILDSESLFVAFGDLPIPREVSDINANRLPSSFIADYGFAGATACANVSAASFAADHLAAEQIVAAFGSDLSATTAVAQALPLPTSLGGVTVKIADSKGVERFAGLFFVSSGQINYLLPADVAEGIARVTIMGNGKTAIGLIDVAPIAPSLFAANADGQGLAAAVLLRVRSDGSQSYEHIAQFDSTNNRFVAVPIEFGEASDQLFLLLYGTGLRHNAGHTIKASIGGVETAVQFAGAAEGFAGLDQINLNLPRSLAGHGEAEIRLTIDDQSTNAVKVLIR
ncbi:MAG: pre-peptidase C-terminal domain-containing protein [Acidobacteria bacterium]|nr:pre-peptidase C-terminal domain-containing protein [Acidobacteriota bacterium]